MLTSDPLRAYADYLPLAEIDRLSAERQSCLKRQQWATVTELFDKLELLLSGSSGVKIKLTCSDPVVSFDFKGGTTAALAEVVQALIQALRPWRKGPFSVLGNLIDSEWRSDLKWERIAPALGDLTGKRIADIGCNNGYYMFRALARNPELVVGFDPGERCYLQFALLQRLAADPQLSYRLLGVEHFNLFRKFFDVALCLGVIYHQQNPVQMLKRIREGLVPGGQLIIESLGISGEGSTALFPADRYAKMRNVYFVPTVNCLISWLKRAGFEGISLLSDVALTPGEQRTTVDSPGESLADFLNPQDSSVTVEGYPAPRRIAMQGFSPR